MRQVRRNNIGDKPKTHNEHYFSEGKRDCDCLVSQPNSSLATSSAALDNPLSHGPVLCSRYRWLSDLYNPFSHKPLSLSSATLIPPTPKFMETSLSRVARSSLLIIVATLARVALVYPLLRVWLLVTKFSWFWRSRQPTCECMNWFISNKENVCGVSD